MYVWDQTGKKYLDFTAGWGVTCIGHANPAMTAALTRLRQWQQQFPGAIKEIRGRGLLLALDMREPATALRLDEKSREQGLLLNLKHGTVLRIFPALNITQDELDEGRNILHTVMEETL